MRLRWRTILIDIPVLLVDLWFLAYRTLLLGLTIVSVTLVVVMFLLAMFGIRWGW